MAEKYTSFDSTPTFSDIEGFLARNPDYFLVAEDETGRILGFITAYEKQGIPEEVLSTWGARRVGYIDLMAVDLPARRRGVGESLLRNIIDRFRKNGIDIVNLDVPAGQEEAMRLYEKLGFSIRAYNLRKRLY